MWNGELDKTVPYVMGKNTYEVFAEAGFNIEFVTGVNQGHVFQSDDVVQKFFNKSLK